jgi:hypothetical protein
MRQPLIILGIVSGLSLAALPEIDLTNYSFHTIPKAMEKYLSNMSSVSEAIRDDIVDRWNKKIKKFSSINEYLKAFSEFSHEVPIPEKDLKEILQRSKDWMTEHPSRTEKVSLNRLETEESIYASSASDSENGDDNELYESDIVYRHVFNPENPIENADLDYPSESEALKNQADFKKKEQSGKESVRHFDWHHCRHVDSQSIHDSSADSKKGEDHASVAESDVINPIDTSLNSVNREVMESDTQKISTDVLNEAFFMDPNVSIDHIVQ